MKRGARCWPMLSNACLTTAPLGAVVGGQSPVKSENNGLFAHYTGNVSQSRHDAKEPDLIYQVSWVAPLTPHKAVNPAY